MVCKQLVSVGDDEIPSVHVEYPSVHVVISLCGDEFWPKVGMLFSSLVKGVCFYNLYASILGFDTCKYAIVL